MNDSEHLDFRLLKYIVAIAEAGTFTAAAARLHVSQSALSTQIRTLEDNLGVKIFNRDRGTALTPEGKILLRYGRDGLRTRDQVVQIAQAVHAGKLKPLRLAFTPLVLNALLRTVSETYQGLIPGSGIIPESGGREEVMTRLRDGYCDAAILTLPVNDERLQVEVLLQENLVVCMREDDPLVAYDTIPPSALNGQPRDFTYQEDHPTTNERVIAVLGQIGVKQRACKPTTNFEHVQWMVEHGTCYALVRSGQHLARGLTARPIADVEWTIETAIVWSPDRKNAALSLLVGELRQHYHRISDRSDRKPAVSTRTSERTQLASAQSEAGQMALFNARDPIGERPYLFRR